MNNLALSQKAALFFHVLGDLRVGPKDIHPTVSLHLGYKIPFAVNGCVDVQIRT